MPGPGQRTKWWILEGGSHPHKAAAHSIISRSMLGERARVMQGWVQEEWMEIRLVRRTRTTANEALLPFFHVIQHLAHCGWGIQKVSRAFSMCWFPSPTPPLSSLEICFSFIKNFPLLSFLLHVPHSIIHQQSYWLPLLTTLVEETIITYSLLPGLPTSTLSLQWSIFYKATSVLFIENIN